MSTYNAKVRMDQGGAQMSVESGGAINIETGGKILANGTQAAAIGTVSGETLGAVSATVDSIIIALRGAGIIASS